MNGGDTDTGGTQVNPGVIPPSNPNSQPAESTAPAAEDASVLTISHDQPSTSSPSQPASQSLPTPQPTPIPIPAPAPSPAPSVPPVPPANTPTPQPLPVSPMPTPTTLNSPIPTQPQVAPQPLQPTQPLPPSPLPPQQPAPQFLTQPVFSNNSDSVLQSKNRKKHRKWIVGGLSVIIFIILIALAFSVRLFSNGKEDSQNLKKINEALTKYSSTIIYGDERQIDLTASVYDNLKEYKFEQEVKAGNQEYINKTMDEFNVVNDLINEANSLNLTIFDKEYLKNYKDKLQFLKVYIDGLNEDPFVIIKILSNDGEESAISYLEAKYNDYINSSNYILHSYFIDKMEYEKLSISISPRTNFEKCIINDIIDPNCEIEPIMTEEEALRMQKIQSNMKGLVNGSISGVINGCWTIYNMVNGEENV